MRRGESRRDSHNGGHGDEGNHDLHFLNNARKWQIRLTADIADSIFQS
jgi:hypothetical protein